MTTQAQIDFELEMAEYYEAAGLDRQAEVFRNMAAEKAEAAAYAESGGGGPGLAGPVARDRPQPEPEPEAEPEAEI